MTDKPERKKYPSELADRYPLRMPDGLMPKVKASAKANNRTVNAEIVSIIESSYSKSVDEKTISAYLRELKTILEKIEGLALHDELRKNAEKVVDLKRFLRKNVHENEVEKYFGHYNSYISSVKRFADSEYDRIINYGNMSRSEYIEELRYWAEKDWQTSLLYADPAEEIPQEREDLRSEMEDDNLYRSNRPLPLRFRSRNMDQPVGQGNQNESDEPQSLNPHDDLEK